VTGERALGAYLLFTGLALVVSAVLVSAVR
jgi:hypothetical protein